MAVFRGGMDILHLVSECRAAEVTFGTQEFPEQPDPPVPL